MLEYSAAPTTATSKEAIINEQYPNSLLKKNSLSYKGSIDNHELINIKINSELSSS